MRCPSAAVKPACCVWTASGLERGIPQRASWPPCTASLLPSQSASSFVSPLRLCVRLSFFPSPFLQAQTGSSTKRLVGRGWKKGSRAMGAMKKRAHTKAQRTQRREKEGGERRERRDDHRLLRLARAVLSRTHLCYPMVSADRMGRPVTNTTYAAMEYPKHCTQTSCVGRRCSSPNDRCLRYAWIELLTREAG